MVESTLSDTTIYDPRIVTMATKDEHEHDTAELAFGGQSDIRHHSASTVNGPLPTDSMVTVELSDSPNAPILETSSHDDTEVHNDIEEDSLGVDHSQNEAQERKRSALVDQRSSTADENVIIFEEDPKELSRESTASMASIFENRRSFSAAGTIRSRSDSSGTLSSTESAQVDWDELERSEEQAPRGEGSDEVGSGTVSRIEAPYTNVTRSRPRFSLLDLNKRTTLWQQIPKLLSQEPGPGKGPKADHRPSSNSRSLLTNQQSHH